eukprot:3132906-Amphidinium_carterae.1
MKTVIPAFSGHLSCAPCRGYLSTHIITAWTSTKLGSMRWSGRVEEVQGCEDDWSRGFLSGSGGVGVVSL